MKLELRQESGVHVLSVTGPLSDRDGKIIRSGIVKLFRDGKNTVVLNLIDQEDLSPETIREFVQLNLSAHELAGALALSVPNQKLLKKILDFTSPPTIIARETISDAIKALKEVRERESREEGESGHSKELLERIEKMNQEIRTLKESLKQKEQGELSKLKAENAKLKEVAKVLESKIVNLIQERKIPPDLGAMLKKVETLEKQIEGFMAQDSKADAPKS